MTKSDNSDALKAVVKTPADSDCGKPRVRDRIFDTACDLFYRQGIRCVGVDTIASEAGTNKMSFYRNFPSKDHLIEEYLQKEADEYLAWWNQVIAPYAGDPRRQIEALFEAQVAKVQNQDCHGCAFMNAAVELRETDHDAMRIIHNSKAETRRRFRKLAKDAGARTPDLLGDALTLISSGNLMTRISFADDQWPGEQAPKIVKKLLQAYID
jgi:AcrR family transcriptional regulator